MTGSLCKLGHGRGTSYQPHSVGKPTKGSHPGRIYRKVPRRFIAITVNDSGPFPLGSIITERRLKRRLARNAVAKSAIPSPPIAVCLRRLATSGLPQRTANALLRVLPMSALRLYSLRPANAALANLLRYGDKIFNKSLLIQAGNR